MSRAALHVLRAAALWAAFALSQIVAASLLGFGSSADSRTSGSSAALALVVANLIYALVLAWLAARCRLGGVARFAALFTIVFGAQAVMTHSETLFFSAAFDRGALDLPRSFALNAITACVAAATASLIFPTWPPARGQGGRGEPTALTAWAARLTAAAALYVVAYFIAGSLLQRASPAVRAFYEGAVSGMAPTTLAAFQLVRGFAWSGLILLVLAIHRGGRTERALAATTAVTAFLAFQLLYPNSIMPAAVRHGHLLEILASMIAWGLAASWILAPLAASLARTRPPP